MVAVCPHCQARYRVKSNQLSTGVYRARCTACGDELQVEIPPAPTADPGALKSQNPKPAICMLLADADVERARGHAASLAGVGVQVVRVQDGVAALLAIHRQLPPIVVLDADLPRMAGLEICEVVKRNPELAGVEVFLAGPVAPAGTMVGVYVPDQVLAYSELVEVIRLRVRGDGESVSAEAEIARPDAPSEVAVPADPDPEARSDAERLARIIVADIILYEPKKFAEAIDSAEAEATLEAEMRDGRALFARRIDPRIRAERDYVGDELLRVVRERRVS